MPVDPDDLAVAALRRADARSEDHDDRSGAVALPDRDHLDDQQLAELAALRRVVAVGRSLREPDRRRSDPPDELWSRIDAEVFGTASPSGTASSSGAPAPSAGAPSPSIAAPPPADAAVVDLASARRARRAPLLAAAAVAVLVLGALGIWAANGEDSRDELVASTDLSLLAGGGSGRAELRQRDDGVHLVVDVAELSPAEQADFYELWLLTAEGGDPQSMAKFDQPDGRLDVLLPEGTDTAAFPVVDISEEIDDGDDTHSGLSILRGSFN
jgi:hypothetical protein